jgi:hypothetical protein
VNFKIFCREDISVDEYRGVLARFEGIKNAVIKEFRADVNVQIYRLLSSMNITFNEEAGIGRMFRFLDSIPDLQQMQDDDYYILDILKRDQQQRAA